MLLVVWDPLMDRRSALVKRPRSTGPEKRRRGRRLHAPAPGHYLDLSNILKPKRRILVLCLSRTQHKSFWQAVKVVDKTEEKEDSVITVREKERFSNELTVVVSTGQVAILK
jgi:hypothetical protein